MVDLAAPEASEALLIPGKTGGVDRSGVHPAPWTTPSPPHATPFVATRFASTQAQATPVADASSAGAALSHAPRDAVEHSTAQWPFVLEPLLFALALLATVLAMNTYFSRQALQDTPLPAEPSQIATATV